MAENDTSTVKKVKKKEFMYNYVMSCEFKTTGWYGTCITTAITRRNVIKNQAVSFNALFEHGKESSQEEFKKTYPNCNAEFKGCVMTQLEKYEQEVEEWKEN